MLPILQLNWYDWMPKLCRLGFRSAKGANVTFEEGQVNLVKLSSFYFNKTKPPNFIKKQEFVKFVDVSYKSSKISIERLLQKHFKKSFKS